MLLCVVFSRDLCRADPSIEVWQAGLPSTRHASKRRATSLRVARIYINKYKYIHAAFSDAFARGDTLKLPVILI